MKSQNDWSFRNHESYETWAAYVVRNKTHKVLLGDLPPAKDIIELIMPATPVTPAVPAPAPRVKKLTAEEKLINYCIVHEGFKYNQWSTSHYDDFELRKKLLDNLEELVIAYGHGRLSDPQITYMGRNVLWTFADDDLKVSLAKAFCQRVRKFWEPLVYNAHL